MSNTSITRIDGKLVVIIDGKEISNEIILAPLEITINQNVAIARISVLVDHLDINDVKANLSEVTKDML